MSHPSAVPPLPHAQLRERADVLHREVHDVLQEEFAATLRDLQQLRSLLGDATGKLSQAFHTMLGQARAQSRAVQGLGTATGTDAARDVRALAEEITRGSMLVVQSLQFEDMASQLLAHVDRRLVWLETFARHAAPLHSAVANDIVGLTHGEFTDVERRLAAHRAERMVNRQAVQQASLDEGDIELF
ncbi:MAG: hypothetical protein ACT4P7_03875 [Gemmatimonadaceae bacterium]